ncbi:MAG TPA: PQQ-dependent sugar dehydrogenase [Pirellulales bacterium]|nr:PQQ-dependent sugar dehydrogenase [Pirellulales bacterium]
MKITENLLFLILAYLFSVTIISLIRGYQNKVMRSAGWLNVFVIAAFTWIVDRIFFPGGTFLSALDYRKSGSALLSAAIGCSFAQPWWWVFAGPGSPTNRLRRGFLTAALVGCSIFSMVGVIVLAHRAGQPPQDSAYSLDSRFEVREIAKITGGYPIRIAVDSETGRIYFTKQVDREEGIWGEVGELVPNGSQFDVRIVASSPALYRPFGLCAKGGALYVSRSGMLASATNGKITYANSGRVTKLEDLDGDGYFKHYNDILTDLPGSRGPDTQHQNNAVCVSDDGTVFVECGCSSNRGVPDHPWEGTVLRLRPGAAQPEVFARGFRNPFGMTFGPDSELFLTDNDCNADPGDEINHVIEGRHYGHPYVIGNDDGGGDFTIPIWPSKPSVTLEGLAYSDAKELPEDCRGCLYVSLFSSGHIGRYSLQRNGDDYKVTKFVPMFVLPIPIDIAASKDGRFYIVCLNASIYEARLKKH